MTELDIQKTVKKSNILNEMRNANASMAVYRLFCVYLAHLPMNSDSNRVEFTLADYARITGLDRPRSVDIKVQAENVVATTATIMNLDGGFDVYSLFLDFKLFKRDEQWIVSLECNPLIAPMIREQRGRFLRYKLYNTIRLKSYNQQRIYELLKQYERLGEREISLADLREFLSIGEKEYPVWGDFSQKVLKVAQKALREHTDICFEYEPIKRRNTVKGVRFIIRKNEAFIDQLNIEDFLPETEVECDGEELEPFEVESAEYQDDLEDQMHFEAPEATDEWALFREVLPDDLTDGQIRYLVDVARKNVPFSLLGTERDLAARELLREKVLILEAYHKPVYSKVKFLKQAIEEDWQ